jgi:hypothetical protein
MTDDLIKRLHHYANGECDMTPVCSTLLEAADSIEQLVATCGELVKELNISRMASVVMDNTVEELHVKLTKAMAGLRKIADHKHFSWDQGWTQNAEARIASAALAELEEKP